MLEKIKNVLSKLGLFEITRKLFSGHLTTVRSYFFRKNALKSLEKIRESLADNNIVYFLVFGTLLGAIREKGFIHHDLDIDFGVFEDVDFKNLERILADVGFILVSELKLSNNGEVMYQNYIDEGTKISIDFYKFVRKNGKLFYYDFLREEKLSYSESIKKNGGLFVYEYEMPLYNLNKIDFYENKYNIFDDYDNFLKLFYGENYRVPIKNFDSYSVTKKQKFISEIRGVKVEC